MSAESRRKSRFRSLCDDHEDGKGMKNGLQCRFVVSYVGETAWRDEYAYVHEIMENILPKQMSGKFWLKKEAKRKVCLFIDVCATSVFIQNTEGISEKCFQFCNIKEVIYCGNMKQYSKNVILVVDGEADSAVKAHIFSCSSVKEAKKAFKVFTDVFAHVSNEKLDFNLQVEAEITDDFSDEITSSPHLSLATNAETGRQNSLSESKAMSPEVEDNFVDNAFTAFARSRSFNSGKRYTPGSRQKLLRPYSSPGGNLH